MDKSKFLRSLRLALSISSSTNNLQDLTTSDLSLDVYLTAHIYKMSGLRAQEKAKGRFGTAKNVVSYKRPYGCAGLAFLTFVFT